MQGARCVSLEGELSLEGERTNLVESVGFGVWGLGFGVCGFGFRV